jgi:hypothetical protein
MELVTVLPVPAKSRRVIPPRSAQIEDEWWIPALRIAFLRTEKMSQVIRAAVIRYVGRHKALLEADPEWPACGEVYRETGKWTRD